jgi:hypothetical protein
MTNLYAAVSSNSTGLLDLEELLVCQLFFAFLCGTQLLFRGAAVSEKPVLSVYGVFRFILTNCYFPLTGTRGREVQYVHNWPLRTNAPRLPWLAIRQALCKRQKTSFIGFEFDNLSGSQKPKNHM